MFTSAFLDFFIVKFLSLEMGVESGKNAPPNSEYAFP